ncbi:MAG: hypothetical protein QOI89_2485 [Solirubrobacteraceae bacterium]|nr:hypothetical protein [Solirubrobacteraceae bacterium]
MDDPELDQPPVFDYNCIAEIMRENRAARLAEGHRMARIRLGRRRQRRFRNLAVRRPAGVRHRRGRQSRSRRSRARAPSDDSPGEGEPSAARLTAFHAQLPATPTENGAVAHA